MDCELCGKWFKTQYYVNRHKRQVHELTSEPLKRGRPNCIGGKFACTLCNWTASSASYLRRHVFKQHGEQCATKKQVKVECPVDDCNLLLQSTRLNIVKHIIYDHSSDFDEQCTIIEMHFSGLSAFKNWKIKEEEKTMSRYVLICSSNKHKEKITYTYGCHRSGPMRKKRGKGIRPFKIQGSCKIGKVCPAVMAVSCNKDSGMVYLQYFKVHIGHGQDLSHLALTKKEKDKIDSMIGDVNLDDTDNGDEIDSESVTAWIDNLRANNDNTVRYVRYQDSIDDQFPVFAKDDFILILMTDVQKEMLIEFGHNLVCIDSTLGTKSYNFQVTTLSVFDEYNEGVPVAFCYSNRTDINTMKCFFNIIKRFTGQNISVKNLITSDVKLFKIAWSEVMGPPENKLLCSWRVDRSWRKSLASKVKGSQELRISMYEYLRSLMQWDIQEDFQEKLDNFMHECESDENTVQFGEYFLNDYFSRINEWAYCYRVGIDMNLSIQVEAFQRMLNQVLIKGLKMRKLEECINALFRFVKCKLIERLMKLHKNKLIKFSQNIKQKHKYSLLLSLSNVTEKSENCWEICSTTTDESYIVKKEDFTHTESCALICSQCNICIHSYSCTCCENSLQLVICKHIHLLVRYLSSFQVIDNIQMDVSKSETTILVVTPLEPPNFTDSKIQELNKMIDRIKEMLSDEKIINDTTCVNFVRDSLTNVLSVMETRRENKLEILMDNSH